MQHAHRTCKSSIKWDRETIGHSDADVISTADISYEQIVQWLPPVVYKCYAGKNIFFAKIVPA
jgi:hypothetical protein